MNVESSDTFYCSRTSDDSFNIQTAIRRERRDYPSLEAYTSYIREMWKSGNKPETRG